MPDTTIKTPPAGLSFEDASAYTGVSRSMLYKLASEGRITIRKIGRRSILNRADLDKLVGFTPANVA